MFIKTKNSNLFFEIDDEDFERIAPYSWYFEPDNKSIRGYIKGKKVFLHRYLLDFPVNKVVDHINNNRLDARKCNLRICEHQKNSYNRRKANKTKNTSKFKGVSRLTNGCFRVKITIDKRAISLGTFSCEIEAAKKYDLEAEKHHGEFASLNFK